jgi:PIN domain nuclease of toxin-antitoxin system
VKYLLDTHLLLWASTNNVKLPTGAAEIIADRDNQLWMSVISLWEVAIKSAQRKPDFLYEPEQLRIGLLTNGYEELKMESRHVFALKKLPSVHTDPFDRLLVAQAITEGMFFLTADRKLSDYGERVILVR